MDRPKRQNGLRQVAEHSVDGNRKATLPIGWINICNILINMTLLHAIRMFLPYTVDT
jgi:hypothetical protein